MKKTAKQLERYFKGIANHHRLEILDLIAKNNGITVDGITKHLNCNFRTISDHTQKLVRAGLVNKKYQGRAVTHSLSPYGKKIHKFISNFE